VRVELTDAELARLRYVLGAAAGLFFDDNRRASLGHGIERRLAATGIASVARYVEAVEAGAGGVERQALVDEVTIQETHFFRNPPQVRALREHVLPTLLRDAATSRRLRIWSAGCSTGEEPYTIAMLLLELLAASDAGAGWDIRVVGTDISNRALATARSGRYGERAVAFVEPATLARWFTRDGPQYVVRPQVRDLVELRHHNLAAEPTPFLAGEDVDLILCRNVTIYLSRDVTRALLGRLHAGLRPGGYLFIGHSETLWQLNDDFHLVVFGSAFVYQRAAADGPPVAGAPGPAAGSRRRLAAARMASQRRSVTAPPGLAPATRAAAAAKTVPAAGASTVAATVGHDPRPSLVDARTALAAGRYDDAATMAMAAAADAPMSADAHYVCGLALVNLGRDREALVALRKAVYAEPSAGLPQFVLAGVLVRLGEFTAAARCYCSAADALAAGGVAGDAAELGGRTAAELAILCRSLGARAASSGLAAGAEQPRHPPAVLRCPPRRRSGPK